MEKRVLVNLENCYGIKKLDFEFSFEKNKSHKTKSAIAIYASNGSMKSSFARTLFDFQNNFESSDQRFPHRKTIREINNENGDPLKPDQIYVIHPFVESFESDKISLLLATKELKARYEKIYTDIYEKKKNFISIIKKFSKIREYNVNESFILRDFNEGDIYSCLEKIEPRVKKLKSTILSDIKYKEIFNSDVESFLKNLDNKKLLTEYIERFNELIEEADFFVKDIFTHNNAYDISKYLAKNGFYEAKHEVILKSENLKCSIQSEEEFNNLIESEKKRIFDDEELIEKFEKIDTAITKKESLRNFRIFLEKNKFIIPFLINLDSLREELWLSYIKKEESSYNELLSLYISGKSEIEKIIDEAKKEITQWEEVKDKFNSRFNVPFTVEIVNREDIILKGINEPTVKFIFKDSSEEYVADRTDAMNVLSQGEKKALYLLDIIYEIEARRKKGQETIFVIDDIADSFDYMNKYAIVEYMMDISKESFFYQVILTHNFDFFRTLNSRFIDNKKCYVAEKGDSEISLKEASNITLPIKNWIKNISTDEKYAIALIPFVRNVIEYTKGNNDLNYKLLTSMLHLKSDTHTLTIFNLETILKAELPNDVINLNNTSNKIYDTIKSCSTDCLSSNSPTLDEKIVLSIGIRLQAEDFIVEKLRNKIPDIDKKIQKCQTGSLVGKYKEFYPLENKVIDILDRVNLMTPENIHLNSFMYEPLIDMSGEHLCKLYKDVSQLR